MYHFGFGLNKSLFAVILISDCIYITICLLLGITSNRNILYGLIVIVAVLKFPFFTICYKHVTKILIIGAFFSVIISFTFQCYIWMQMFPRLVPGFDILKILTFFITIAILICAPFTIIANLIMLLNIYILNRMVKWGMDLPVSAIDGSFKNKIDRWAEMLVPGL